MIFFCHQELYQAIDSLNGPPKLITMNICLFHVCDNLGTWWSGPLLRMACTSQPWFLFQIFEVEEFVHGGLHAL